MRWVVQVGTIGVSGASNKVNEIGNGDTHIDDVLEAEGEQV